MSWIESAMWNEVLAVMEAIVITLCTWYFLSHTEQSIEGNRRYRFFMLFLYWAGFMGITFGMRDNSYVNLVLPIFMIGMTMLTGYCLYNRREIYQFYYFLFPATAAAVQIFISYLVLGYMSARWGTLIFDYHLTNIGLMIRQLTVILLTGVWIVLLNRRKYEDVKGIRFAGLFLPPAVSAFIIFSLICIGNVFMQMYGIFLIIMDIIFLVVMNLYIWYLFSYQSRNKKLKAELEIRKRQSEMQYQYYERVEQQYQSSRKMIHDMRNHLQAIETLKVQDALKAREYMKDIHQILDSFTLVEYTDNRMLNIILNEKAKTAKEQGIIMDIQIGEIGLSHIRDMDITTIFANLLDNALEAAKEAEEETKRRIQIRVDTFHDFVVVRMQNTVSAEVLRKRENERGEERKNRKGHMGVGLSNVRHTLEKYGGGIMAEIEEDVFIVNITIPGEVEV